jgi:hypothetical protein
MNWLAIINELFDIGWLLALLFLLILIWRSGERREKHAQSVATTLIDVSIQNAESARIVAEAVRALAAIVQNEQAKSK